MDRTLDQAERDFDRALSDGARAVSIMQEKLTRQDQEAKRLLAAVVLSAGGTVDVMHRSLIDAFDATLTMQDNPRTGGITITAKRT